MCPSLTAPPDRSTPYAPCHVSPRFVSVTFGVNGAVRTALASRRTDSRERNSDRRNPRWDERVQLPVTVLAERKALPTNTIRVAVLDHDFGRADQVIGQVLVRFDEVQAKNYALFRWFNLYGPAPGEIEHPDILFDRAQG